jgi:hypothetical protein
MVNSGAKHQRKTATVRETFSCRVRLLQKAKAAGERAEISIVAATVFPITYTGFRKALKPA